MKELNTFRKFLVEGTWSLGSARQMAAAMTQLQGMMREEDPTAWMQAFEDLDSILYRVFGDDSFHDYLGASKAAVEAGDIDRAKNALGDALGVAEDLYNYQLKQHANTFVREEEELEENDSVLDEIIGEEKEEVNEAPGMFDEIDEMIETLATHMSAEAVLKELMSELQVISGGTKVLHSALKNIMMDADLMETLKEYYPADGDIDKNVKLIAAHMSTQEALENLVAWFDSLIADEGIPGGRAEIGRALRNIVADNELN